MPHALSLLVGPLVLKNDDRYRTTRLIAVDVRSKFDTVLNGPTCLPCGKDVPRVSPIADQDIVDGVMHPLAVLTDAGDKRNAFYHPRFHQPRKARDELLRVATV